MSDDFFRFPHIPHIVWLGNGTPRDDKVLSSADVATLLRRPVVVEEKLDGANLGFSVDKFGRLRTQNRGQYLVEPHGGQFQRLREWTTQHGSDLSQALGQHLIAFGEWCAARHSLDYAALPDWWLLFDVYDRRVGKFWSSRRRNALGDELNLATVPRVANSGQTIGSLRDIVMSRPSCFRDGPLEGVVVRNEDEDWLLMRGKVVRADFSQGVASHWRTRKLEWNRVQSNAIGPHQG